MATPAKQQQWYANGFFWLVAIAIIGLIGTNLPPDHSAASPAPSPVVSPEFSPVVAPAPAPAPTISPRIAPATPTPITNNNVIVLGGSQDVTPLLDALPQPAPAVYHQPQATTPPPEVVPKEPLPPANQSAVQPSCLPQMVAHHERVAEFYRRMMNR